MNIRSPLAITTAFAALESASASDLLNVSETNRSDLIMGQAAPVPSRDIPWNRLFGDAGALLAQSVVAVREASLVPLYVTVVSALTLASGAYLFYRTFRFKEEWDVRYRPFGPLRELNELAGLETPTLRGALQAFGRSLDPRKKPQGEIWSLTLNPEEPLPGTGSVDESAQAVSEMTGFRVVSGEELIGFVFDKEVNRHGVALARRFIGLLRARFDEIDNDPAYFELLHDVFRLVKRLDSFLRGLDRMAERDPRYRYYRLSFGHAFREVRDVVIDETNSYMLLYMQTAEHRKGAFERDYFLQRFPEWRRRLDEIETSVLQPMENGSFAANLERLRLIPRLH